MDCYSINLIIIFQSIVIFIYLTMQSTYVTDYNNVTNVFCFF